jgi:hypothetical protein
MVAKISSANSAALIAKALEQRAAQSSDDAPAADENLNPQDKVDFGSEAKLDPETLKLIDQILQSSHNE